MSHGCAQSVRALSPASSGGSSFTAESVLLKNWLRHPLPSSSSPLIPAPGIPGEVTGGTASENGSGRGFPPSLLCCCVLGLGFFFFSPAGSISVLVHHTAALTTRPAQWVGMSKLAAQP